MKKTILKSTLLVAITALFMFSCQKETEVKVTGMSIKKMPTKSEYYVGEYLELTGLVVTLTKDNGSTEDVAFENFEEKGIFCSQDNVLVTVLTNDLIIIHVKTNIKINEPLNIVSVTDIDNNVYPTVRFGEQIWMAANLKTTRYQNGDEIGTTDPINKDIENEETPSYQWDATVAPNGKATYGRYYTGYAVNDSRNICPVGWHVPTEGEINILKDYLGGGDVAGKILIEYGYRNMLAGTRSYLGYMGNVGYGGTWWLRNSKDWNIYADQDYILVTSVPLNWGFSVLCLKD